ncbi:hypothetical protein [Pedobacter ureilyticus]|uniref:Uncharacterized protein n=1 Tax=Pedobacter ureilyticus TaxID=1393051 RepID=A0ABW9J4K2_9SPHI|nr:hypothetical protein [Pedobacter helvus]
MVDKERRQKLALHLRHLAVGLISNDEFEDNITDDVTNGWLPEQYYRAKEAKFDDKIIQPMLELCWGLYDDTRNHKLIGADRLSEEALKVISRCILFLKSDQEYEWPYFDQNNPLLKFSLGEIIITILSFGQYYRDVRKEKEKAFEEFKKLGDFDIWPFLNQDDYQFQLKHQPFFKIA